MAETELRRDFVLTELQAAGAENVSFDAADRRNCSKDFSWYGITVIQKRWKAPEPDFVVWPTTTARASMAC